MSVTRTVTNGNLLVLAMGHSTGTQSITNDGGQTWTQQVANTGGNPQCTIWTAISVTSGSITVEVTKGTSGAFSVCLSEFNDEDQTTPVTSTDSETISSGTSKYMASPAMTPDTDGAFVGACHASGTPGSPSFSTATQIATSGRGIWCYRLGAVAEDGAFTHTTASTAAAVSILIKPVSSGALPRGLVIMQAVNRSSTY